MTIGVLHKLDFLNNKAAFTQPFVFIRALHDFKISNRFFNLHRISSLKS